VINLADIAGALRGAGLLLESGSASPVLTGITDDSRQVRPGELFCAVRGSTADGHTFLDDAVRRGAGAALVGVRSPRDVPQLVVTDTRRAVAVAAATWYGNPGKELRLIGVTGTNGKSTTVALIRHLLNERGDVGSVGTLGAFDGAGAAIAPDQVLTTPGAVALHRVFRTLRERGVRTCVMEASSHALDQQRLAGLSFVAAVFTNLTHDHLDYHADLDAYRAAKLSLVDLVRDDGTLVVNAEDPAWQDVPARPGQRVVRFGRSPGTDVGVDGAAPDATGVDLELRFPDGRATTRLPLIGDFNVANALGAAAAAWATGVPGGRIAERLATAPQVVGRMERVGGNGFVVLRDYAHTPDALDRVIQSLRVVTRGRLVVLFGCGGDRDRRKRPIMGGIAARGADLAVVTSDNPRTEDPERIIDEIETGMEGVAHLRVTDRREAIRRAVGLLGPGDCLVLAGKGHETYQIVGTTRYPMDEPALVREALALREKEGTG
jgi:UDP-N-acetylmuramoyl-L-alanyl-D-glutamate--2,6-diaminopimelate ligase